MADATRGVGVLLGLLGSIGINVGNNMQALGMGKIERQKRRDSISGATTPEASCRASSDEPAASRSGAGASTPAIDLEDESSSSAEPEHPNAVALRSLKGPDALNKVPKRTYSQDAPSTPSFGSNGAVAATERSTVGQLDVARKDSKEHLKDLKDGNTVSFKDRRPLVRTLTSSAMAITDSVGNLVPQLTPSLLSPRGVGRMESFNSLDTVEYAGRIPCLFGGQCIKVTGTVIFITGSVINFIAFALAPASILAPLESIQASPCHATPGISHPHSTLTQPAPNLHPTFSLTSAWPPPPSPPPSP